MHEQVGRLTFVTVDEPKVTHWWGVLQTHLGVRAPEPDRRCTLMGPEDGHRRRRATVIEPPAAAPLGGDRG